MILNILNAALWRLGGAGAKPLGSRWRKFGYPILVGILAALINAELWRSFVAVALAAFAVTCPITYYGSEIRDNWFNWVWLWILGIYFSGPLIALGIPSFLPFFWSFFATLSNIKATSKIFTWEFCECFCGFVTI